MGIDFRRADAGVAEHLLDGEKVGATFEQMCGETVSERVRTDGLGDAVFLRQVLDNQEDHLSREARATTVEKNSVGEFGLHVDVQSCPFDVLVENFQAAVSDGNQSFLASLAKDA